MSKQDNEWAICRHCGESMAHGCRKHWYVIGGRKYEAIPMGDPREHLPENVEVCHDCNARRGEYHHPGCDMERCPKCGLQLIGFHAPDCGGENNHPCVMEEDSKGQ